MAQQTTQAETEEERQHTSKVEDDANKPETVSTGDETDTRSGIMNSFDDEFAENLRKLESSQNREHLEVQIIGVPGGNDSKATVEFRPPIGENFEREFEMSASPTEESEFDQLLADIGHNYNTASNMIGDRVPAEYSDGEWRIRLSTPDHHPLRQKAVKVSRICGKLGVYLLGFFAIAGITTLWPITGIPTITTLAMSQGRSGEELTDTIGSVYFITMHCWLFGWWLTSGVFGFTGPVTVFGWLINFLVSVV